MEREGADRRKGYQIHRDPRDPFEPRSRPKEFPSLDAIRGQFQIAGPLRRFGRASEQKHPRRAKSTSEIADLTQEVFVENHASILPAERGHHK